MPWIDDVSGVFEAWYGGEQVGPALAGLLFGDVSPSGKLPMSFPKSLADVPTNTPEQYPGIFSDGSTTRPRDRRRSGRSTTPRVSRWATGGTSQQGIEPLFAFGHGLSYTDFEYSHVQVTPKSTDGEKEIRIRFRLTNTGDRAGTEIAQAYVELPDSAGEPSQRLVGWEHVTLQPGEHRNVEITLSSEDLADLRLLQHWNADAEAWQTASGTYTLHVGGSVDAEATSRSSASGSTTARRRRSAERDALLLRPPLVARRPSVWVTPPRTSAAVWSTRDHPTGPPSRASRMSPSSPASRWAPCRTC